jgi:hypothetical protein
MVSALETSRQKGVPGVERKFRIEDATFHEGMFQKELEPIAAVDVVDKHDAFAPYQIELEDHVCEEEFVDFGAFVKKYKCQARQKIIKQSCTSRCIG